MNLRRGHVENHEGRSPGPWATFVSVLLDLPTATLLLPQSWRAGRLQASEDRRRIVDTAFRPPKIAANPTNRGSRHRSQSRPPRAPVRRRDQPGSRSSRARRKPPPTR